MTVSIPPFAKFRKNSYAGRLITFDPGETTGYSIWDDGKLTECGQLSTFPVKDSIAMLVRWLDSKIPYGVERNLFHVMIEEYRIYSFKTEQHAWSDVHTIRLIGCLETLLTLRGVDYGTTGAGLAKAFAKDEKLEAWGLWQPGQKHARDAIRHALYFYCQLDNPTHKKG